MVEQLTLNQWVLGSIPRWRTKVKIMGTIRIISGSLKGRIVNVPMQKLLRPTSDRTRTALFNILSNWLPGKSVLELFAGTGIMSFESISRGANSAVVIEQNPDLNKLLKENLDKLGISEKIRCIRTDVWRSFPKNTTEKFDLVFADPPYFFTEINKLIEYICEHNLVHEKSLIIIEQSFRNGYRAVINEIMQEFKVYRIENYGAAALIFLKHKNNQEII